MGKTLKNPEIEEIINFVKQAIKENLKVNGCKSNYCIKFSIHDYSDNYILFIINFLEKEIIIDTDSSLIKYKFLYTERDKLVFDNLCLDVKEYNHAKTINYFNNFFKKDISYKVIDNLEDEL